jgi:hypothetical protein
VVIGRPLALLIVAPLLVGAAALPASAAATKAEHACKLLTRAEIESVLSAAPLDPGPTKRAIPQSRKRFTNCRWDDEREATSHQLAAFTTLARKLKPSRLTGLGVAAPGSAARDLTATELEGLGDRGTVEIIRDGTYGNVAIVKGKDAFLVSAAYQGPGPSLQITEADMIALARLAAARI